VGNIFVELRPVMRREEPKIEAKRAIVGWGGITGRDHQLCKLPQRAWDARGCKCILS